MPLTVRTVWRTQKDPQVCPTCKALEGYTWVLDSGDAYPKQLIHPVFGPVYDMRPAADGSLVKEGKSHICRCTLEHQFDVSNTATDGYSGPAKMSSKRPDKRLSQRE